MSKSLGNVINPDDIVRDYGADTLRVYEMFIGDYEKEAVWSEQGVIGAKRFIDKVSKLSALFDSYGVKMYMSLNYAAPIDDPEVDHRILFWQQKLYNVDGFLYYAVNDWYGAGSSQHNWGWDKKYEKDTAPINPFTFYGNGVLLYHGGFVGRLHECVESVRLESIRDGIEDYDYFNLIDEKYGEGTSTLLIKQITTSLGEYSSDAELFNKIRLAAGDLIAPEIKNEPEETETDKAAETEKETDKETEKAAETGSGKPDKGGFMSLWYLPLIVMGVAVAAVIIVRVIIMRNILKK